MPLMEPKMKELLKVPVKTFTSPLFKFHNSLTTAKHNVRVIQGSDGDMVSAIDPQPDTKFI